MKESTRRDDIRNLSLVWGAGITAGILTLAMLLRGEEPKGIEVVIEPDPVPVVVEIPEIELLPVPEPVVVVDRFDSGSNRLYGTVVTVRGREYEGYIRWDKNEGSWADLLDANKTGAAEYGRQVRVRRAPRARATVVRIERDRARIEREVARAEREVARAERDRARVERELERDSDQIADRAEELAERIRSGFTFQFGSDEDGRVEVRDDDGFFVVSTSGEGVAVVNAAMAVAPRVVVSTVRGLSPRVYSQNVAFFGGSSQSGIRFGHVRSIRALDSHSALFTLKSGQQVELSGNASDLGSGVRAIIVEQSNGRQVELNWSDLDVVNFYPAPETARPQNFRMYGTMMTRSGVEFTGYVTWDVDEIYSDDILDGEERGHEQEIPFGDIERIERYSSRSAFVTLKNGEEMVLDGSNDVNSSNSGISVSDPLLGQVKVGWDEFESVRFHEAKTSTGYSSFDGGQEIYGTVVTEDGGEYSGTLIWDQDEAHTWEMLNGSQDGVEFHIEFSKIASIAPMGAHDSVVTLKDGRTFEIGGSNDVDSGNRGISVQGDGNDARLISWDEVREVRFQER
jgi:hypothetical protein